ncbi:DNA-binding domain-containing protein [Verrucomicrobium spinosum]|uniref:HvfC/BufC N-terminal domain-containing protein n=1 Tax=Verrucomicrobium spinosum TaxID=2736 RepID=UPI0001746B6B|nr:DUF2063 domain-containing protein [Verrucomicrobium spinosum]
MPRPPFDPSPPSALCPARIDSVASWRQLQLVMSEALFRPLTRHDGMQPRWTDGRPACEVVDQFIIPNDRMSAFERLEVYNRQYWYRLLDCLYDDYPGLRVLLGERRFHRLCREYLAACPSGSWTLRNLGRRFAEYLEAHPLKGRGVQARALDLARTEWAQTLAFDEGELPPVRGDDLLGADAATLRFRLQPHLVLLELGHAVDRYMDLVRMQDAGLRGAASHAVADRAGRPVVTGRRPALRREHVWLAVHRYENTIYFKRLDLEAFRLLAALRDGRTLSEALELALADADPHLDWGGRIRGMFETWAALGWLCHHPGTDVPSS